MIGKISVPRGTRLAPLVYYLFGPGRREDHTDPHLVAGWRHPAELEPPLRPDGGRDFRQLLGLLAQPHAAMGDFAMARPVWHCSLRAAPEDKALPDEEWAQIAGDVMHRTGLSRRSEEDEGVRWIAVRHGPDHIHLVAMLARQDFRRPRLDFERYRVREACRTAEQRYGLRRTAPGDRTAAPRYPELLGWAALTRSLIAWYQGDPARSAAAARRGQAEVLAGTVARAKLAAQEMRCLAMTGDAAGMSAARGRAATAMSQLGTSAQTSGIYSVPRADDPPYTATALLLAGRHREAADMTRRIIETAYSPHTRAPGDQPTNYARTLLILALAAAGLGEIDEAAAAGVAALESGRVVWPTMVLAGQLDHSLAAKSPGSPHAADFRARYIDATTRPALPAAPGGRDTDD